MGAQPRYYCTLCGVGMGYGEMRLHRDLCVVLDEPAWQAPGTSGGRDEEAWT